MYRIIFYVAASIVLMNCTPNKNNSQENELISTNKQQRKDSVASYVILPDKDTMITLSNTRKLFFSEFTLFKDGLGFYSKRYLLNEKSDTIASFTNYSEVWYELSPDKSFIILDDIRRAFLDSSTLFENAFCFLVELETGNTISIDPSDCGGEWNNANQWVSGDEIIFSSDTLFQK